MIRIRQRSPAGPFPPWLPVATAVVHPRRFFTFLLLAGALLPAATRAQELPEIPDPGDTIYEVGLADGSLIIGRISELDPRRVVITTVGGGTLEIDRTQIRSLRPAEGRMVNGEYWNPDPTDTRLYFTANGRTLEAGEAYVGTYLIVLPFAAVGITDRVMVYGGAPIFFGEIEPYYVGGKVQVVRTSSVQASVGTLAFGAEDDLAGIAYGVGTFGDDVRAFSAGIGFFYSGDDVASEPAFMVGAEARVSRRMKLITENYILPEAIGALLSGGFRYIGDRFSAEIGVFGGVTDGDAGCCFPLINFSYAFGR